MGRDGVGALEMGVEKHEDDFIRKIWVEGIWTLEL